MKTWRLLGQSTTVATTFTAFGGTPSSPFTPDFNGQLIGLRVLISRNAASTLIDGGSIRLTSTSFNPNSAEIGFTGTGLQTAPANEQYPIDYDFDQPVQAGVPVNLELRNITSGTPVTPSVFVFGLFLVK